MLLGDELDRHYVFFGDGSFCVYRHKKNVLEEDEIPKIRFLLHPQSHRKFGIRDDELEPGDVITKYYNQIDVIPFFSSEYRSFVFITKDIFGNDTSFSLELEHLTSRIISLQQELEALRGESERLTEEIEQIKNRPSEWARDKSQIFDQITEVNVIEKKDEEGEEESMGE